MKHISKLANGEKLRVDYALDKHFSITGDIRNAEGTHLTGGAIHDAIEAALPGMFTDLIALHLSDREGVPMHALANGLYFLNQGDMPTLQKHLRLSADEAENLVHWLDGTEGETRKIAFADYINELLPRWKAEAEAAITRHRL